jgi:O-antigen/teichoic acid export membrane protein
MTNAWARIGQIGRRIGGFLLGQGAVQGVNLVAGFAILWLLPTREYALYIICSTLIAVANLGTDMGLTQGLITLGSRASKSERALANLLSASKRLRTRLVFWGSPVLAGLGAALLIRGGWNPSEWTLCLAATFGVVLAQQRIAYFNAIFNIRQDVKNLFSVAIVPACARVILVLLLCSTMPYAAWAVVANAIAASAQDRFSARKLRNLLRADHDGQLISQAETDLKRFVRPLVPGVMYYVFQGQIAVIILGLMHYQTSIAEVGALGRLGQLLSLLSMLNPFFVQPRLARLGDRQKYIRDTALMFLALFGFSTTVLVSTFIVPAAWLLLLGPKYEHLTRLLPLAVATPLIVFLGGYVYTAVISRGDTQYQWLQVPLGLTSQVAFIVLFGVHGTREALVLSLLPAAAYLFLQLALFLRAADKSRFYSPN